MAASENQLDGILDYFLLKSDDFQKKSNLGRYSKTHFFKINIKVSILFEVVVNFKIAIIFTMELVQVLLDLKG